MSPLSSLKQLINSSDKTLTHSAPAWFFWLDQSLCCMQPIEYRTYIYAPGPADSHIWGVIIRPRCTPTLLFSYKLPNLSAQQNGIQNVTGIPTLTSLSIFCIWNSLPTSDFGISSCNLSAASRTWTGRPKQTHKYNQSVWYKNSMNQISFKNLEITPTTGTFQIAKERSFHILQTVAPCVIIWSPLWATSIFVCQIFHWTEHYPTTFFLTSALYAVNVINFICDTSQSNHSDEEAV